MKIAILSRGPSLAVTMPVDSWRGIDGAHMKYNCSIGVNNIPLRYKTDYACVRDWDAFHGLRGYQWVNPAMQFMCGVRIGQNCWDFRTDDSLESAYQWSFLQENGRLHIHEAMLFPMREFGGLAWYKWTGTAALGSAFWMCHRGRRFEAAAGSEIHCYGVDMTGESSFDGQPNETRKEVRWEQEQRIWRGMVDVIEKFGCRVIVHEGPSPTVLPA